MTTRSTLYGNACSFSSGFSKGISKQMIPAIYAFGIINGGNALGFSGLAANSLSVCLGIQDVAKGIFNLVSDARGFNHQETSYFKKANSLAVARNIYRVVVGLAMINTIFSPTSQAKVIVSAELIRCGLVNTINGIAHLQRSFNSFTPESKQRDWAGIGEALISTIFSINNGVQGAVMLVKSTSLEQERNNDGICIFESINENTESKYGHAVEINADWDHNGVFNPNNVEQCPNNDLRNLYKVYSRVVKNQEDVCNLLRDAREAANEPINAVLIKAHGNMRAIILDEGQVVSTTNVGTIAGCLRETLSKKAPIFLSSCNTARPRAGNRLNFAERLAGETGHPVFASTLTSYPRECHIEDSDYKNGFNTPVYSCVHSDLRIFFEDSMPDVSNPATSKYKEYNSLIKRVIDDRDETTARDDWLYTQFTNKITEFVPAGVWSTLARTHMWQALNKWWERT